MSHIHFKKTTMSHVGFKITLCIFLLKLQERRPCAGVQRGNCGEYTADAQARAIRRRCGRQGHRGMAVPEKQRRHAERNAVEELVYCYGHHNGAGE